MAPTQCVHTSGHAQARLKWFKWLWSSCWTERFRKRRRAGMFPHRHLQVHRARKQPVSSWETPPEVHENGHLSADKGNSHSRVHSVHTCTRLQQQATTPGSLLSAENRKQKLQLIYRVRRIRTGCKHERIDPTCRWCDGLGDILWAHFGPLGTDWASFQLHADPSRVADRVQTFMTIFWLAARVTQLRSSQTGFLNDEFTVPRWRPQSQISVPLSAFEMWRKLYDDVTSTWTKIWFPGAFTGVPNEVAAEVQFQSMNTLYKHFIVVFSLLTVGECHTYSAAI